MPIMIPLQKTLPYTSLMTGAHYTFQQTVLTRRKKTDLSFTCLARNMLYLNSFICLVFNDLNLSSGPTKALKVSHPVMKCIPISASEMSSTRESLSIVMSMNCVLVLVPSFWYRWLGSLFADDRHRKNTAVSSKAMATRWYQFHM